MPKDKKTAGKLPRIRMSPDRDQEMTLGIRLVPPKIEGGLYTLEMWVPEDPRPKADVLEFENNEPSEED